jgi:dipeptidyl aminopeptidase/acylaminoacyl peptidase
MFQSFHFVNRMRATCLVVVLLLGGSIGAVAAPINLLPVEGFFQNPVISQVSLSPDGQHLGMLVALADGRVRLATMQIDSSTPKVIAGVDGADVASFNWVNNNRLVFDLTDRQIAVGDKREGPGLFAVNRDGTEFRRLIERTSNLVTASSMQRVLSSLHALHSVDHTTLTDEVYIAEFQLNNLGELVAVNLLRLNTVTGRFTTQERPGNSRAWVIDQNGKPRVTTTFEKGVVTIFYRDLVTDRWRKLAEFDALDIGFEPSAFGPDGTFYVVAAPRRDKKALYTYDLTKNQLSPEPVFSLKDYDFQDGLITSANNVLGVRFESDAPGTFWFDERMKKIQKAVDEALPATANRLEVASKAESPFVVVHASSDVQPTRYLLYNTRTAKFTVIGSSQPAIDPRQMAHMDMVRYPARDGLEIPAYLTKPRGIDSKNLPMVVLVHGGPWVRGGSWRWNSEVQFLASRGYAVLQPEFRGSTGFGYRHFHAGWKQWGLKMQDDIADGVRWAIQQGIADPKRICIAGASYGGYATLMGLVNDPQLYQCGINWVGVTDINLLYSVTWSDTSEESIRWGMPRMIGDRDKDAAQLKATSPIMQAARITKPLLMAYGGSDRRVPLVHGTQFRDAVKTHNPRVEWILYLDEGHGWSLIKNRVDFWSRVEQFLDRNIGSGATSPAVINPSQQ